MEDYGCSGNTWESVIWPIRPYINWPCVLPDSYLYSLLLHKLFILPMSAMYLVPTCLNLCSHLKNSGGKHWRDTDSGLVGCTHVGLLTKTDIVKWATPPPIKATTILHTLWISTTVKPSQIRTADSIRHVPWALVKQADLHFQHFHY